MSVENYYFSYQYIIISRFVGMLVQMEVKNCYRIYSIYLIFRVLRFEVFL